MSVPPNQEIPKQRVLVLGRDIRAFLAVIRSLGRAGLEIHVVMCSADDLALQSDCVRQYHVIPEYEPDSTSWIDCIRRLFDELQFSLVIPTHDESAIPMQIYRDELASIGRTYCLEPRAFEIAFDKIKSSELAAELGVKLPKQTTIEIEKLKIGRASCRERV